jgi:hypothetical protein
MTIAFIVSINFYSQTEEERAIAEKRFAQLTQAEAALIMVEAERDMAVASRIQAEVHLNIAKITAQQLE